MNTSSYATDSKQQPEQAPRLEYVTCASPSGVHRMAYWEWGDPSNDRVLLCVHGLTRTGRDFDPLARRLSRHYRVVCPDVVGRGRSDWLLDPHGYAVPQYVADMLVLIARLNPARLDWVGTSMGGLVGLGLAGALAMSAAMPIGRTAPGLGDDERLRIGKMVLNDIGPRLQVQGLARIAGYVSQELRFDTFEQAVDYVRGVSAGFGEHDQADWEELTRYIMVGKDGGWVKHYDLRIGKGLADQSPEAIAASESLLWMAYESLERVLVLRGELSDLIDDATQAEMLRRNPRAAAVLVGNVGHAPTLRAADQLDPVEAFLLS
ncbi:MAG: alpha/beta hydrolase [Candidimonas sp.]|jgi:pimeloyl-ACP methyl ester carboxylesterase